MLAPIHPTPGRPMLHHAVSRLAADKKTALVMDDDTSLAAFVVSQTVESVMRSCNWPADNLQQADSEAVWLLIDSLHRGLGKMLDYSPDVVTKYASLWIFRDDPEFVFGDGIHSTSHDKAIYSIASFHVASLDRAIERWLAGLEIADVSSLSRLVLTIAFEIHVSIHDTHSLQMG